MQVRAVWHGHGNGRGHWRLICGGSQCAQVLGFVDPVQLDEYDPLIAWIKSPEGTEYHPNRDGVCSVSVPTRRGRDGIPLPQRGGKKRHLAPLSARRYYWFDRLRDEVRETAADLDDKARQLSAARARKAAELHKYPHLVYSQRSIPLGTRALCPKCGTINALDLPSDRIMIECDSWLLVLRTNDPLAATICRAAGQNINDILQEPVTR